MHKRTELNLILFCFILISTLSNYLYCHKIIEEFICVLFYLSMWIDNLLWSARVAHFNVFNFRTKGNSKMRYPLSLLNIILFLIYFFSRLIYCVSSSAFHYISLTFRSITNHLQSWSKYLRQALVFKWNSALWDNFNFCFRAVFC